MTVCSRNSCAGGYGNCLDVKITNACNARCAFCIERDGFCPESLDVKKLIESTVSARDFDNVLILGGEPLLYQDLLEYLAGIRAYKKNIYLTTNGSLLNVELARSLSYYLDGINISIHHYSEFLNDKVFQTVHVDLDVLRKCIETFHCKENLDATSKPYVPVRFNTNLVKGFLDSQKDVQAMIWWAAYMGVDEIRFSELQNCEELWVDSQELFSNLPNDPYSQGCEQLVETNYDIKVVVKMTCGRVNRLKPSVNETPKRTGQTNVLYPNAKVYSGWINSNFSSGCHTFGCH